LHFNLTGGSFPDISVSTGIHTHTHTHTTLATKECGTLLGWAGGGTQLGDEGFSCHSGLEISLERRGNYTKANDAGSERLPASGLCVSRAQPTILQLLPWTLTLPDAAKGMRCLLAHAENPKLCSEKALSGLVTVQ